jgi:cephalosporin hydroxylase/GT2 family glycosyltransferase
MIDPADPRSEVIRDFHRLYYDGLGGAPPQKRISFLGVETVKCPLDLWIYQEILHRTRPEVIVECGVFRGGTTLYLASLCDLLGFGEIVACDITLRHVHPRARSHPRVSLLEGSSTDLGVHAEIVRRCRGRRTMVILDSDHSEAHVAAELRLYGPLVSRGCYLVCEDTNVNGHPAYPEFGPGPFEAVQRFLAEEPGWRVDLDCEKLLVSFNPSGYLVREGEAIQASGDSTSPRSGLTSVIVPCGNRLDFIQECVAALLRHTRGAWELIAVDNGSNAGTAAYLAGFRDAGLAVRIEVITDPECRGVSAAFNRGLVAARGDYLVLLDPRVVVTDGWVEQLVALAATDPKVGVAGPMANSGAGPQRVEGVPYGDRSGLDRFAAGWRSERRGRWSTVGRLSGVCLLMKRCVLEALGGLDERSQGGDFDDEDLAFRVKKSGFTLALAQDLFVHDQRGSDAPLPLERSVGGE